MARVWIWFPVLLHSSKTGLVKSEREKKKKEKCGSKNSSVIGCHIRAWQPAFSHFQTLLWVSWLNGLTYERDKAASKRARATNDGVVRKCVYTGANMPLYEGMCMSRPSWILYRSRFSLSTIISHSNTHTRTCTPLSPRTAPPNPSIHVLLLCMRPAASLPPSPTSLSLPPPGIINPLSPRSLCFIQQPDVISPPVLSGRVRFSQSQIWGNPSSRVCTSSFFFFVYSQRLQF